MCEYLEGCTCGHVSIAIEKEELEITRDDITKVDVVEEIGSNNFKKKLNTLLSSGYVMVGFTKIFHNGGRTKYIQIVGKRGTADGF